MLRRLGYVGISLSIEASSNRGTILRNVSAPRLRELIGANLAGLRAMLEFNNAHAIRLFRISSQIIPFGGHPANDLAWWDEFAGELAELGAFIRANDLRVSMHPGQFTLLSSPSESVTEAALRDLAWHGRLLDAMGLDGHHKLVVHGGGAYGDKPAATERWTARHRALPAEIRARLVVENDERTYSTDDALRISALSGAPVLLDVFHRRLKPDDPARPLHTDMAACFATWGANDGPPKIHMSSQSESKRFGAHADYIEPGEFIDVLTQAPETPFDCMLEAKAKDLALFRLRDQLAALGVRESEGERADGRGSVRPSA